ncbi:DUF3310 domain-containing protein [Liquorilactobacillus satsumensis]|uniref:DUF3310 domain-containing protein n=1 Tax=Liquorilactobacillus satsumensis TaxID=259059 RepID=UPI0039EAC0C3
MSKLRPDYYKGKNGHDLFWFFETFLPKPWVIGFYTLNIIKYVVRQEGKNGKSISFKNIADHRG